MRTIGHLMTCIAIATVMSPAHATTTVGQVTRDEWGYSSPDVTHYTYRTYTQYRDKFIGVGHGDFIVAGGLGKTSTHGTWGDEWGVVGIVAYQIVEHGGYFCPLQIQCNNKKGKQWTGAIFFKPSGYSNTKCAWLCEAGYGGNGCQSTSSTIPAQCDNTAYTTQSGGKFANVAMKTSGKYDGKFSDLQVFGWASLDYPDAPVVLGVVKFMEHGVIAAPVRLACGRNNWKDNDSYVESIDIIGTQKLLCPEGYKPNAGGTDCEPFDAAFCAAGSMNMCANFPQNNYDPEKHAINTDRGCVRYFCAEPGYAFPSAGDTTCQECATDIKGGPHPDTGVCTKCTTGQYFDKNDGTCKAAAALSKTDLQYGRGKTQNSQSNIDNQCWTKVNTDEYQECVMGKTSGN